MSKNAQAILDEIKALPPDEQREVCDEIVQFQVRRRAWETQKTKLRALQQECAGQGLLNRLLEERGRDRARERSHE